MFRYESSVRYKGNDSESEDAKSPARSDGGKTLFDLGSI